MPKDGDFISYKLKELKQSIIERNRSYNPEALKRHMQIYTTKPVNVFESSYKDIEHISTDPKNLLSNVIDDDHRIKSNLGYEKDSVANKFDDVLRKGKLEDFLSAIVIKFPDAYTGTRTPVFTSKVFTKESTNSIAEHKLTTTAPKIVKPKKMFAQNASTVNRDAKDGISEFRTSHQKPYPKEVISSFTNVKADEESPKTLKINQFTNIPVEQYKVNMLEDLKTRLHEFVNVNRRLKGDVTKLKVNLEAERSKTNYVEEMVTNEMADFRNKEKEAQNKLESLKNLMKKKKKVIKNQDEIKVQVSL